MELYQLRTFLAVAAERNLTRAAESVHTSAPAVSAQIKSLEDELGVRLFERTSRGMVLTLAGQRLVPEARRTLEAASGLRAAAAQIRGAVSGVVRMGAVIDPIGLRLGEVMVRLAELHPDVTLRLQQGMSQQLIDGVRRGELDCAYVLTPSASLEDADLLKLSQVPIVIALPARWALMGLPETNLELARKPWISTPQTCGLYDALRQFFREVGIEPPAQAMADSEAAIRGMVASGMGAGLMREDQALEAQRAGQVVVWEGWRYSTGLCWVGPLQAAASPAVEAVRQVAVDVWSRGLS